MARFAQDLFGEPYDPDAVLFGDTVEPASAAARRLAPSDYGLLEAALEGEDPVKAAAALRARFGLGRTPEPGATLLPRLLA